MGLRYEYEPPQVDSHDAWGNFDPNSPTGMVQQTNGNALYKTDKRDFGPRLGFAWDVTGKGTTVVRAGTSITYDTVPMDALVTSLKAPACLPFPPVISLFITRTAAFGRILALSRPVSPSLGPPN